MKAAVFDGKAIKIKEVPKPFPDDSQALIKIKSTGICGTDVSIVEGNLPTPTPLILGHEFSGIVEEVGKNVELDWLGKRVTSEINANIDFNCFYCRRKLYTQCISRKAIGIDINGSFAEYIAVDSYLLHDIPNSISFNEATFIEPLAAAYQTFETMPLENDDKVICIFGLGKLGLLITQVALSKNLELIVIDGSEKKLRLAKKLGAQNIVNRLDVKNIPDEIKKFTGGLGADIVVDATGNPNVINEIINSCRTRGKLHIKSTHGLDTPISFTDIVVRELTIYSSRCGPFEKAIDGLKSGKISVEDLISRVYPLDAIKEAFASYKADRDNIKTILTI
ncbi:MAG: zinc-binding dehydrogenase [Candidatus Hodarchaeota archaeon]